MLASPESVFTQHEFWRPWTTLFAHANEKHLFSNLVFFSFFGVFLSGYFGLFLFPFLGFLVGGLVNFIVLANMPAEAHLLGASGVVFWMGGAWLSLYMLIDLKRSLYQRALRGLGVALAVFMPSETFDPQVSYSSHFYGFILGVLCGVLFYVANRKKFARAVKTQLIIEEPSAIQY